MDRASLRSIGIEAARIFPRHPRARAHRRCPSSRIQPERIFVVGDGLVGVRSKLGHNPIARVAIALLADEARFEEEFLEPLIRRWGFSTHSQYPIEVKLGSSNTLLYVDQYLSDEDGPVILIESKREIINARQLDEAMAQARSYALQLGFPAFIVASPQGLWLYKLRLNQEELVVHEADVDALVEEVEGWRELVLGHRKPHV